MYLKENEKLKKKRFTKDDKISMIKEIWRF